MVTGQLRLFRGRVGTSTTLVNSLGPQMSELVEDAVAYCCGDIVGHFWLIRNELQKFVELNLKFSILTLSMSLRYFGNELYNRGPITVIAFLEGIVLGFCFLYTEYHTVLYVLDVFWFLFSVLLYHQFIGTIRCVIF